MVVENAILEAKGCSWCLRR